MGFFWSLSAAFLYSSSADFQTDDFSVLDKDKSGTISVDEFIEFFADGVKFADPANRLAVPVTAVESVLFFLSCVADKCVILT